MARKVSRRKEPNREDYRLKEKMKIEEDIFDTRTMLRFSKLFDRGIISELHFKIATGKEADIYLAVPGVKVKEDIVVVKVFRAETSTFRNRMQYITGDPRFGRIKSDIHSVVNEWCKKEFGNLKVAEMAGVHAPRPYAFSGNILTMEFIGRDGMPARTLKDEKTEMPEETLDTILGDVKKLYGMGLVHADLSEYNVLMKKSTPYLIDFGQAVVLEHRNAMEFLHRDINTILTYFKKTYGIERNTEKTFKDITGRDYSGIS